MNRRVPQDASGRGALARVLLVGSLSLNIGPVYAQGSTEVQNPNPLLEEVFIFGDANVRELAGSAAVIDSEQIRIEAANDVNQLLKTVPGIYIREEDGYGLRPNIGVRGATSERSSKITLLEDGVMIAPAPYSGPAAYYFPTTLRAHRLEVLKGAPLLRYGPQTTGGVVNVISTPIPTDFSGNLSLRAGENGEIDALASLGGSSGSWGWSLETAQRRSDGFKTIDRSSQSSGFELQDYVGKIRFEQGGHSLLLKAQYSEETSDETYLGLTDTDFHSDPNRRYGLSLIDEMTSDHTGVSARYRYAFSDATSASVLLYNNDFSRNWFKLANGNTLVDLANAGVQLAQDGLDGDLDLFGLEYRNNDRDYFSRGVEFNIEHKLGDHDLNAGLRVHEDEVDRIQPVDVYDQIAGELVFFETIAPTGPDNRVDWADAESVWFTDAWTVTDALRINATLRYESVTTQRIQYADPNRQIVEATTYNNSNELLPGLSLTYNTLPELQLVAGVHRGFSPLGGGAQDFEDPETSDNYELGLRYTGWLFAEAIGFYSDFSNKTENCSNANPCSNGAVNGAYTTGAAVIQGVEVQISHTASWKSVTFPLDIAYTFTDATLSETLAEEGLEKGDILASIPRHTFSLRAGIEIGNRWGNYLVVKFIDEMCVDIGCNRNESPFQRTDSLWVADFMSRYQVSADATIFAKLENLSDEQRIVSRQPDGARPNKPRTASVGLQYSF